MLDKQVYETYKQEKGLLDKVDHIICLSKYTENLLTASYGIKKDKISLVYNGLKDDAKGLKLSKQQLRKELLLSPKDKMIIYVGRLHKDKGGKELTKAFRLVINQIPNSKLIIIGSGETELYQNESDSIWSKIIHTGKINKEQVYKFYQIADVGVLPSFTEQCSYVAIEMMMFGLPIVGTNSTGLAEMIEDGISGHKVMLQETKEDVILSENDLAEKIIKLLQAPNISQFRQKSREKFLSNYTSENMQTKLNNIIHNKINDSNL